MARRRRAWRDERRRRARRDRQVSSAPRVATAAAQASSRAARRVVATIRSCASAGRGAVRRRERGLARRWPSIGRATGRRALLTRAAEAAAGVSTRTGAAAVEQRRLRGLDHPDDVERQVERLATVSPAVADRGDEVLELDRERLAAVELRARRCRRSGRRAGTRRTSRGPGRRRRGRRSAPARARRPRRRPSSRCRRAPSAAACSARASSARRWRAMPDANARVTKATSGIPGTIESRPDGRDRRRAPRRASSGGSRSRAGRGPRSRSRRAGAGRG